MQRSNELSTPRFASQSLWTLYSVLQVLRHLGRISLPPGVVFTAAFAHSSGNSLPANTCSVMLRDMSLQILLSHARLCPDAEWQCSRLVLLETTCGVFPLVDLL